MNIKKLLLFVQSALCVILVAVLSAGVIGIYREGAAEQQKDPLAWVYTREKAATVLKTAAPVFFLAVAATVACEVMNARDEIKKKPVRDAELRRETARPPKTKDAAPDYRRLRAILLAAAVVFIILGIVNGSMSAVVNKAIRICTECVGLG